MALYRSVKH